MPNQNWLKHGSNTWSKVSKNNGNDERLKMGDGASGVIQVGGELNIVEGCNCCTPAPLTHGIPSKQTVLSIVTRHLIRHKDLFAKICMKRASKASTPLGWSTAASLESLSLLSLFSH